MTETIAAPSAAALVACSVFDQFDGPALRALLGVDATTAGALLSLPEVEHGQGGMFRLRPELRPELLRELRRQRPQDERSLHRQAFEHFVGRLARSAGPEREAALAACMHHLRALRDLNLHYLRWREVEELIAALRAASPELPADDALQLALFEAYHEQRRQRYERCDELVAAVLAAPGLPDRLRAEALLTRGLSAYNQARLELAQADFVAAQEAAARAGDEAAQGRALVNQSWVYNELDQYEAAMACAQAGLAHYERANDLYGAAFARYCTGNQALHLGRWALGAAELDQAAAIYTAAGIDGRLVAVDWGRGFMHQLLGNERESRRAYRRVVRATQSAEDSNLVAAVDALANLGLLYQMQRRWRTAQRALRRAIALAGRLGADLRQALLIHRYSQLLAAQGRPSASRARLAAAVDQLERLRVSTQAEELKISLLGTSQQVYEAIVLADLARGDLASAFAYVERARARAFLDLLARRSEAEELPALTEPVGLAQLQARLAPDALLLEYFTVGVEPPGGALINRIPEQNRRLRARLSTAPRIFLFAITADDVAVHTIDFDPNSLRPAAGDPAPGWHLLTERKLAWLYRALLAPVEGLLRRSRSLHIVPHGPLHYVPFAALRPPSGGFLLDRGGPALSYAPSATLLARCLDQPAPAGRGALALGYDDRGPAALLLAEREARLVSRLAGGRAEVGPGPKSPALAGAAAGLRWLHIAGHAVYRADDPLGSYLRLGAEDDLDARAIMRSLSLPGALVTLNACASGLSHVASGDELLGLPRAFLYAGAAAIVCALHEVDDIAAYTLMVLFAEFLAAGHAVTAALHQAQLRLRSLGRREVEALLGRAFSADERAGLPDLDAYGDPPFAHPRYWASFMLVGRP